MGRILLAQRSEKQVRQLYADMDQGSLMRLLETWERDQHADHVQSIGRFESGISSVAAPVLDMSGQVVAAMSATDVTESVPAFVVDSVQSTAHAISVGLGWRSAL